MAAAVLAVPGPAADGAARARRPAPGDGRTAALRPPAGRQPVQVSAARATGEGKPTAGAGRISGRWQGYRAGVKITGIH